jgi:hypothetical protein
MGKRQGPEYWRRHLEAWHRSELTQAAYCAAHGLSSKSFYRWLRRQKEEAEEAAQGKSSLTLVPVSVGALATGSAVRLQSPGGWRIELPGGNVSWLVELLRQLP